MPIVLLRVDERLIHGQVVVGWGGQLRPDRYLVVDSALVANEWEQELHALGVPEGTSVEFLTPGEAREKLDDWRDSELRSLLLIRDLGTVLELCEGGRLAGETLNLGGLHLKTGREEVLPYLFLDESDRRKLILLSEEGMEISAQDLPGSSKVGLEALLG
jgi:PTS system mannose-specific IIB component/fructoselysine and glucoselysine-specific PTS system IIB component